MKRFALCLIILLLFAVPALADQIVDLGNGYAAVLPDSFIQDGERYYKDTVTGLIFYHSSSKSYSDEIKLQVLKEYCSNAKKYNLNNLTAFIGDRDDSNNIEGVFDTSSSTECKFSVGYNNGESEKAGNLVMTIHKHEYNNSNYCDFCGFEKTEEEWTDDREHTDIVKSNFIPDQNNGYIGYNDSRVVVSGKYFHYYSLEKIALDVFSHSNRKFITRFESDVRTFTKTGYEQENPQLDFSDYQPGVYDLDAYACVYSNGIWYYGNSYSCKLFYFDSSQRNKDIKKIGNKLYYFPNDNTGLVTSFFIYDNNVYYALVDNEIATGELKLKIGTCTFDEEGKLIDFDPLKNWSDAEGNTFCEKYGHVSRFFSSAEPTSSIEGLTVEYCPICNETLKWYCFKDDGSLYTNSLCSYTLNGEKYTFYATEDGSAYEGWKTIDGKKYYFSPRMLSGDAYGIGDKCYCFNADGTLYTDTLCTYIGDGEKYTYYATEDGSAYEGWKTIENKKYYFSPQMLCSYAYYIDEEKALYCFNDDGTVFTNGWFKSRTGTYFWADQSGISNLGWKPDDNKWIYVKEIDNENEKVAYNTLLIPNTCETIEENAFEGSSAQVIVIPTGCKKIGKGAFYDCPNLRYIIIYSDNTNIVAGTYNNECEVIIGPEIK